jgi:long-chain acyl-CoA synthetase
MGSITPADYLRNIRILEGDITNRYLGLDNATQVVLSNEIEEVFHCAASTEFNWPLEKIRKVNTEGTDNVLSLCLQLSAQGKLKKINHISTAYLYGTYKGAFNESDLDKGQKFVTTYEQSKFEAEQLVSAYREKGLWIDIFRPPLIIGESSTGKTFVFSMVFYQILHLWRLEIFDSFPARNVFINIIPVDILARAVACINAHSNTRNACYHPFPGRGVSLENILDVASQSLGFKKPKSVDFRNFDTSQLTDMQKMLLKNNISAFNPDVVFDSTVATKLLSNYGFEFPVIDDAMLSKLLLYPKTVKFGR